MKINLKTLNQKENIITPPVIFVMFFTLYNFAIIIERMLFDNGTENIYSNYLFFKIVLLGLLSLLGYYSAYIFIKRNKYLCTKDRRSDKIIFYTVIMVFLVSFIICAISLFKANMIYLQNYDIGISFTYNNPVFSYAKEICVFSLAVIIYLCLYVYNRLFFAIIITVLLLILSILVGDKDIVLLSLVSWIPTANNILRKIKIYKSFKYMSIFIVVIILVPITGYLFSNLTRTNKSVNYLFLKMKKKGIYEDFDNRGPYYSLIDNLTNDTLEFKYGTSYVKGSVLWIPKAIWNNRPESLSDEYAREKISNWKPGQGLGYNLMSEAYINFGYLGGFIQYFLIAVIIIFSERFIYIVFQRKTVSVYGIFYIWLIYNLIIMHRGDFVLPSSFIRYLLPFAFMFFFLKGALLLKKKVIT